MNINIELGDTRSIKKAIKQIQRYQASLNSKVDTFVKRVGQLGIEVINSYIASYSIPSEVIGEIVLQKGDAIVSGSTIQIIITNDEALFWEYGTGLIGQGSPHPDAWQYNVNQHKKGWVYRGDKTIYSWDLTGLKDGLHFTKGMPTQPFMWLSYNELLYQRWNDITRIAKEIFDEKLA